MGPVTTLDDAAFIVRIEPARKLVEIAMLGYWDPATARRFDRKLRQVLKALPAGGCRIGDQVTIFDTTAYQVQSPEVLALLGQMAADSSIGSRRIAIVMASALLRMQAKRTFPDYGLFDNRDEAMAWLFEPDA